ncbi:GNAT family N-acetyltransferase [Actinomadura keratinilytica]
MDTDTDTDTDTSDARTGGPAVLLRRALPADAPALAEVWLRSFAAALPTVRRAHGDEAARAWFAHLVTGCETWGAFDGERAVGLLVLDGDELEQLYLAPDRRGQGLGDRLVTLAKERRPAASSCGPSRSTPPPTASTNATASPRPSAPTAPATRNASRTCGTSGRPDPPWAVSFGSVGRWSRWAVD